MTLRFMKVGYESTIPSVGNNVAYLAVNNWDDYDHKSLFYLTVYDQHGQRFDVGDVKIGFVGQGIGWTEKSLPDVAFEGLADDFFSLGQDVDYYRVIAEDLPEYIRLILLDKLKDVVNDWDLLERISDEPVFSVSLTRSVSSQVVFDQYRRVLNHDAVLTKYNFSYSKPATDNYSGVALEFKVVPDTKPSTNIHVLIGRNGIGKTTILSNMVRSLVFQKYDESGCFFDNESSDLENNIIDPGSYFSGVICVSFSIFDKFTPPKDQEDPNEGICFSYVGLKELLDSGGVNIKDPEQLEDEVVESLKVCFSLVKKKQRWLKAIGNLESDDNFAEMNLARLSEEVDEHELEKRARNKYSRMSSGHAIVFYTITKLIEKIEEKTLVIIDEPESHLHPPLISAFIRALSVLLSNRNAVGIIATHSPVLLQEVPKLCVSILTRLRLEGSIERPEQETFGENIGTLTREVFDLEVSRSGFHDLLAKAVESGKSYDEIIKEYSEQIGGEARAILKGMVYRRDHPQGGGV